MGEWQRLKEYADDAYKYLCDAMDETPDEVIREALVAYGKPANGETIMRRVIPEWKTRFRRVKVFPALPRQLRRHAGQRMQAMAERGFARAVRGASYGPGPGTTYRALRPMKEREEWVYLGAFQTWKHHGPDKTWHWWVRWRARPGEVSATACFGQTKSDRLPYRGVINRSGYERRVRRNLCEILRQDIDMYGRDLAEAVKSSSCPFRS